MNPITTNPSPYSIYGLVNYGDKIEIQSISNMLNPQNPLTVYTDWRTGLIIIHDLIQKYDINVHRNLWSVQLGNLNLQLFGSYGYKYDGKLRIESLICSERRPSIWLSVGENQYHHLLATLVLT